MRTACIYLKNDGPGFADKNVGGDKISIYVI